MSTLKVFTLCLLLCSVIASAKDHTVKLLTQGSDGKIMVFDPIFIKISAGDAINFVPADPTHSAESFSVPSEKSSFSTPLGKATKIIFPEEGVVLVKCLPHFALGMVGVIQVGDNVDSAKAKADWDKAKVGVAMNKEAIDEAISKIK